MAKKLERLTEKGRFSLFVQKAVADFDRQRAGARWSSSDLDEIAKSAAIQQGLSYDGIEVDTAIVKAIRVMADTTKSHEEGLQALDAAWQAYSKHG